MLVSEIPKDAIECSEEEDCPCGRGLPYGKCCKPNGVQWFTKEEVLYQLRTATLPQEYLSSLSEKEKNFLRLFGRKPEGDGRVLFDAPAHDNDYFRKGMTFLRNLGLPKEWIYAYYRTDGLMPTVENEKFLSKQDLDQFRDYCCEYADSMSEGFRGNSTSVLFFVSIVNEMFEKACDTVLVDVLSGLEYFLNTVSETAGKIVAPPNSLREYAVFIAIRSIKAIKSIRVLGVCYETESIYSIGRSLFECYVYLKNINNDPGFFLREIYPILSSHDYGFVVDDGEINYRKMHISKALNSTARTRSKPLYQLNSACGPDLDKDLYDYYYRSACQFVHIDAFTARSCFYEEDLYAEFDSALVAIICALSMAVLVLEQLVDLLLTPDRETKDLRHLVADCSCRICDCLMMLVVDPEQKEYEYECLLQRIKLVNGNKWRYDKDDDGTLVES
ncbi:MAG: hypothetical protein U0M96_02445 [Eggerthellaceae bacterium]